MWQANHGVEMEGAVFVGSQRWFGCGRRVGKGDEAEENE